MSKKRIAVALAFAAVSVATVSLARAGGDEDAIARGKYLVTIGSCNDCHTPVKMGKNGPEPDLSRVLSGHPQELVMPSPPKLDGPWVAAFGGTMTAYAGPWGVSFSANLTPDEATGIGRWTEKEFVDALRNGRHQGRGRQLLPPMPWQYAGQMTDADLHAVFTYLRSIPPVKNKVPQPVPPAVAAR